MRLRPNFEPLKFFYKFNQFINFLDFLQRAKLLVLFGGGCLFYVIVLFPVAELILTLLIWYLKFRKAERRKHFTDNKN